MRCQFRSKWVNRSLIRQLLFPLGTLFLVLFFVNESLAGTELLASNWSGSESRAPKSTYSHDTLSSDLSPFSPGSHNISLDLGQVFLVGDLTKFQNTLGTQLHYNYGVSDLFSFDSSLGYSQHSSGQFSLFTLLSGVRMNLSWFDKIIPYGIFGLGFYLPSYLDTTATPTRTSSTGPSNGSGSSSSSPDLSTLPSVSALLFGVHLGAGVDLSLSRNVFFGASLLFHQMFGTTQTMANGTLMNVGGAYATFFLHAGATF